jgi:hypothetical protein
MSARSAWSAVWLIALPAARVKKSISRSSGISTTKFKIRCSKYLYTFATPDEDKAAKLKQALPPSMLKCAGPNRR